MRRFFLVMLVLFFFSTAASAGENYAGFDLARITYEETGFPDAEPKVFRARLGRYITPQFSVEGHIGTGISDDTITAFGIPLTLEIDTLLGVYGRGEAPISDMFKIYGIIGFTNIDATASAFGVSVSDDESDISYGIGAELTINDTISGTIEYINLIDKTDFAFSSLGVGVKVSF